jgi:putative ABC transport system permease protein
VGLDVIEREVKRNLHRPDIMRGAGEEVAALQCGHQIRIQFVSEAITLTLAGGSVGVVLGAISTAIYAHIKGWAIVIPTEAWAGGLGAALLIGALAGLLPAIRASRLSPTQALWAL